MLKSIKYCTFSLIVIFYILQSCSIFSDVLIENIQQIRYQIQISKKHQAEALEFSISDWKQMENKKEFKVNDAYYDVVSIKETPDKVMVYAVKDSFEDSLRIALRTILDKNTKSHNNKKRAFKSFNYYTVIDTIKYKQPKHFREDTTKFDFFFINKKPIHVITITERPPC